MDLVFAGVDEIEAIVGHVEELGEAAGEVDAIVEDLRSTLEEGMADGEAGPPEGGERSDSAPSEASDSDGEGAASDVDPAAADVSPDEAARRVIQATIDVGDSDMSGVDAMFALDAIENQFPILGTDPDREAVEAGEQNGTFVAYLDAVDPAPVETTLSGIGQIDDVGAADVTAAVGEDSDATGGPGDTEEHAVQEIKSVRVDVEQLDDLHGLVEQLVTSRIKLRRAIERSDVDAAEDDLNELDKITASLQNTVMDMRLIPLRNVVGKFPRMVRDLSRELDKDVDFSNEGGDIELDRTILTEISDPLMHIIRNALDHGIEPPDEREAAGKPQTGTIDLRASRQRDHVVIEVEDDGAGLDVEGIRNEAIEQGIRSPEEIEAMEPSAIYDLIFHPGFSTADEVSETSGRGVGMDVVHDTVSQLDGSVTVDSTPGEGTTVSLRLPVTMAIVKVLFVEVGDQEYGIPLKNVDEITRSDEVRTLNGREVIKHDEDIYRVVDLADRFDVPGARTNGDGMLVRIRESERQIALQCDAVESQEEVVVKPLEGILSGTEGLSGTAVLGDGNIVHILDVVTL
jgi:two-component system chemotaxis sensor kinase CheA